MKRLLVILLLATATLFVHPAPAAADLTAFWGVTSTPTSRSSKGIAIGIGLIIVGFEFEYCKTVEDEVTGAPGLTTGVGNLVVMTPSTKVQLYATTGGGLFHESYRDVGTTNLATNVGGGVKIGLAGPIRLRVDYRIFKLNGQPIFKRVQRVYAGFSLSF